jgi:hypothetical protein
MQVNQAEGSSKISSSARKNLSLCSLLPTDTRHKKRQLSIHASKHEQTTGVYKRELNLHERFNALRTTSE